MRQPKACYNGLRSPDAPLNFLGTLARMEDPRYDVAISFLSQDEPLALKLHEQLSDSLSVFVCSKKQEELAGTDGLESFRLAFFSQSRLVVVLYREGWGKTKWTGIEDLSIRDRLFEGGWESLLFVTMDDKYPKWLPKTHVRLSYTKFAHDLVGAIKLRVQELGGELKVETAAGKAQRMKAIAQEKAERDWKLTQEAGTAIPAKWSELRRLLDEKIAEFKLNFELQNEMQEQYVIRTWLATVRLHPRLMPTSSAQILVEIYNGRLLFREELRTQMYLPGDGPQRISESAYRFDYNAAYGWCWREDKNGELFTAESLSELFLKALLETHRKIEVGEIARRRYAGGSRGTPWS